MTDDDSPRSASSRVWTTVVLPVLGAAIAVGAWWLATAIWHIDSFYLPSPPDVVRTFLKTPHYLLSETWVTVQRVLIGFAIAVVGGLVIAVVLAASRTVERMALPVLAAVNAVPKVALAPLLLVWLGFGDEPKIVMVVLVSFFPVIVATMAGLGSAPSDLRILARSLRASWWQTFTKVRLPWALPQIFVGLKVATPLTIIGAVIGEVVNPDHGLGSVVTGSSANSDTSLAFAALVLLALVGVVMFYLVALLERLLVPWARAITT